MLKAIQSTRIISNNNIIDGYLVFDKKVREITTKRPDSIMIYEAGDKVVMPGIVDPHVHINEPGRTEWEGFETATKAAMAGGVTTMIEMPLNASPVTTTVDAFEKKLNAAKNKLHVNCGFWGGIIPGNEKEIEPLIEKGVFGFKAFLTHSGIDEFPNVTEADLRKVMPILAKHNLPLLVHCELINDSEISNLQPPTSSFQPLSPTSYINYLASRPKIWEDNAIKLMIRLCEEFNCRTHIVHLSSSSSISQIKIARNKGLPLTVETAQHYLYFTAEEIPDGHTEYKCAPPIREKENNAQLWEALKDGIIDFVATDHSPAPPEMKHSSSGDLMKAWGGIASIQFSLSSLWTAAMKKGCTILDMEKWLCSGPAVLPGLNKKGTIASGFDADLIVWDPSKTFTVTEDSIHHRHKITPYLNETLNGVIEGVWLAGQEVYKDGKFLHLNLGNTLINSDHT